MYDIVHLELPWEGVPDDEAKPAISGARARSTLCMCDWTSQINILVGRRADSQLAPFFSRIVLFTCLCA